MLASGLSQLTLVESALCPLDPAQALSGSGIHQSEYFYQDENRHRKRATARVFTPCGLFPHDEFFLWGLLALTFAEPEPSLNFYATPHYCLTRLGLNGGLKPGGKNHLQFRQAIERLATVTYQNDAFYDPIRAEFRRVAFGFFSYSLPTDAHSSRAWRFAWDPLFFEVCQPQNGHFAFDLETYRALDPASRRLFLLLKKIFWRRKTSGEFDVRHLAVNVLGYAPTLAMKDLKKKVFQCARRLAEHQVITPAMETGDLRAGFRKVQKGVYAVSFLRGAYFDRAPTRPELSVEESALQEPLRTIGFDEPTVRRILQDYSSRLVQEWSDITLAKLERFGRKSFTKSPAAYFLYNIRAAKAGNRIPPDWWEDLRKEERTRREQATHDAGDHRRDEREFADYVLGPGRAAYEQTVEFLFAAFRQSGQSPGDARANAEQFARKQARAKFVAARKPLGPIRVSKLLP